MKANLIENRVYVITKERGQSFCARFIGKRIGKYFYFKVCSDNSPYITINLLGILDAGTLDQVC